MWRWRPEIVLPLLLVGTVLTIGWWRLSQRSHHGLPPWRLTLALCGLMTIALALLSPLDRLAHLLFSAHMIQHMLLMMVAPPLLLLADPFPILLWALPRPGRVLVSRLLVAGAPLRRVWRAMTWMPVAWFTSALALWLWHLPAAYNAALNFRLLHDVEHLAFFWAGILFWWPIVSPAPRLHGHVHHSLRIVYVVLAGGQQALLGLLLSMSPKALYPFYADAPRLWSLSPLDDQAWGGIIMWGTSGVIGIVTVMVLVFCLLRREERPPFPVKTIDLTLGSERGRS